jgi:hypothetical protein
MMKSPQEISKLLSLVFLGQNEVCRVCDKVARNQG